MTASTSNIVRQIAPKYWIVYTDSDTVAGVIVGLENDTYIPYVDGLPVLAFANRVAAIEYAGILEVPAGKHSETQRLAAA